jgi:hypothetical protein
LFRAAQANECVRLIDHLPIVLHADVVRRPHIAIGVRERQPLEGQVSHR